MTIYKMFLIHHYQTIENDNIILKELQFFI